MGQLINLQSLFRRFFNAQDIVKPTQATVGWSSLCDCGISDHTHLRFVTPHMLPSSATSHSFTTAYKFAYLDSLLLVQ